VAIFLVFAINPKLSKFILDYETEGEEMIKVNSNDFEWEKGLTVEKFLRKNHFLPHLSIVKINGELISKRSYQNQPINDNDDIKIVHLVAGG